MSYFDKWRDNAPRKEIEEVADICFGGHGRNQMKRLSKYAANARNEAGSKPHVISADATLVMVRAIWDVSGVLVPWHEIIGDSSRDGGDTWDELREYE